MTNLASIASDANPIARLGALPVAAPASCPHSLRAATKHPKVMPYRRLMALAVLVNLLVVGSALRREAWQLADGSALRALSALTIVNLTVCVLVRNQAVLDALYRTAGRARPSWPLWLRWAISKVHHVGGLHVGTAVSGTAGLVGLTAVTVVTAARYPGAVTGPTLVLSLLLATLLLVLTACATSPVRMRAHNVFEQTHRWCGWTGVAVFWVLTVHLAVISRGNTNAAVAVATDWHLWALCVVTASIAWPWLRLRRVPITVERPSSHAAIVHLDYGVTPDFASGVGVSTSPLREWHAFATVTTPGRPGYRLLISRAGDWTGRFIDNPPTHLWVRGKPVVAPMAKTALLYRRCVYVVTGSGIGPCLGQILADRVPCRLVWSTRAPRATYGDALVDEVESVQPDAVVWDTTERGKPDLLALALEAYADFGAEAVFIVSNKSTTLRLVHELERRGIPAFGPIWDS